MLDDIAEAKIAYSAADATTSPTKGCLANLSDELEGLVHKLSVLEDRLGGVMNNLPTPAREGEHSRKEDDDLVNGRSPLVMELSNIIRVVKGQRDRIGLIIERLDL